MVELESISDVEAYAIKRREKGEDYSTIKRSLYLRWKNRGDVSAIIQKVVQLERQQLLIVRRRNKDFSDINFFLGLFTLFLGVVLIYALWAR